MMDNNHNTERKIRLDKYIRIIYPKALQSEIEKFIRFKDIKVNGLKSSAASRININNDEIFISDFAKSCFNKYLLNLQSKDKQNNNQKLTYSNSQKQLANKILKDYLIYEDSNFLAINKPAKLATQGGSKLFISVDIALNYINHFINHKVLSDTTYNPDDDDNHIDDEKFKIFLKNTLNITDNYYRLVHRLDKETSGVLLIAKNLNAANKLTKAFKENKITKEYIALLDGKINLSKIKKYQIEDNNKNILYKITSDLIGKDEKVKKAVTCFSIDKYLSSQNASLVKFMPQTGRMHQLRIHASTNIGNAIIGDKKYNPNYYDNQKQNHNKYMMLHAKKIILDQSIFGKEIIIDAPIPQYFNI